MQSPNQIRNRRVPLILRNHAVGHPPTGYPSVFLSAIDVHLEYFFRVHTSLQQEWGSEENEILNSLDLLHFEELLDSNWGHSVGSTEKVVYIPALAELGDLKLEPPEFLNEVGDAVLPFKNLGHTGNFGNISESNLFPQTSDSDESILQEFQHTDTAENKLQSDEHEGKKKASKCEPAGRQPHVEEMRMMDDNRYCPSKYRHTHCNYFEQKRELGSHARPRKFKF